MVKREWVQSGMTVRSVDGERLGHVLSLGEQRFRIEKGLFFKRGYSASYDEIKEVRDGEVILTHGRESLLCREQGEAGDRSQSTADNRVVHDLQTVRIPRVDEEVKAAPVTASGSDPGSGPGAAADETLIQGEVARDGKVSRAQVSREATDDVDFTPTPVRPLKEGGALPPAPGPDGLGLG